MKKNKKTLKRFKRQVKRNNTYSFSSDNNCFINFSGGGNKFNNRK